MSGETPDRQRRWPAMKDADDVERVAAEFLRRYGPAAIVELRDRAEIARAKRDQLSADAWTDIADAAERLLKRN